MYHLPPIKGTRNNYTIKFTSPDSSKKNRMTRPGKKIQTESKSTVGCLDIVFDQSTVS